MAKKSEPTLTLSADEQMLILSLRELAHGKVKDGLPMFGEDGKVFLLPPVNEDAQKGDKVVMPKGTSLADTKVIASYMYQCDNLKKSLEGFVEIVKSNLDAASLRLGDVMSSTNTEKMTQIMGDGMSVNFKCSDEEYVSIKSGLTDEAFLFLLANGMGGIIKETVHHKTLGSQVKAWKEQMFGDVDDEMTDDENVPEIEDTEVSTDDEEYAELYDAETSETMQVQAEEIIREKIDYWLEKLTALRGVNRNAMQLDEAFNSHSVTRAKITYRKQT